ncbi:hypothetical protein Tco_1319031 [Tanacetum coccineum]
MTQPSRGTIHQVELYTILTMPTAPSPIPGCFSLTKAFTVPCDLYTDTPIYASLVKGESAERRESPLPFKNPHGEEEEALPGESTLSISISVIKGKGLASFLHWGDTTFEMKDQLFEGKSSSVKLQLYWHPLLNFTKKRIEWFLLLALSEASGFCSPI